jgi:hypothetical protein
MVYDMMRIAHKKVISYLLYINIIKNKNIDEQKFKK